MAKPDGEREASTLGDEFLEEPEVATRWKMSRRTLQNWRANGTGPRYIKLSEGRGGRVRYPLADIQAYEQARIVQPGMGHPDRRAA